MSAEHARSGDVLPVLPAEAGGGPAGAVALVRDPLMEVMRWVLPARREVPEHLAYGPLTIQCVQGEALLQLHDRERRLFPGMVVYLAGGERHAVQAVRDAVLLITMVLVPHPDDAAMSPSDGPRSPHGERTDRP